MNAPGHNPATVRTMIALSRAHADRGNPEIARRVWRRAETLACRCGGLSGMCPLWGGYSSIVLADGLVAISPLPVIERRAA